MQWRERGDMEREEISLHFFILSLSVFSLSLHVLILSPFPFLICSPFPLNFHDIFSEAASQLPPSCTSLLPSKTAIQFHPTINFCSIINFKKRSLKLFSPSKSKTAPTWPDPSPLSLGQNPKFYRENKLKGSSIFN